MKKQTIITAEQLVAVRARCLTQDQWARELGITVEKLKHGLRHSGLKWGARTNFDPKTCNRGHSRAKFWRFLSGKNRCVECLRLRSLRWREDARRSAAGEVVVAEKWTWLDWMQAASREDAQNHPHWVPRRSDAIKAWLVERGIKP